MAEETPATEEIPAVEETPQDGFTEEQMRSMIGEVLEEKLNGLDLIGKVTELFNSNKPASDEDRESFFAKIGEIIDEKMKGHTPAPVKTDNGKAERKPKINIFG